MKRIVPVMLLVSCYTGFGQAPTDQINNISVQNRVQTYKWSERPEEDGSDLQKKFIKQEWTPGVVYFKSGRPNMQVPLLFDVHNDMLYYKVGETIMEFVDTVSMFSMIVPYKSDSIIMRFRRFYPAIQSNTEQTFYQVLVDGKITLLKCLSKGILLFKDDEIAEEKKKEPKELYFAYMPGHKITQVWLDAEKTMKSMSEYEWMIKEIMKKEKIKLKDEGRLADLFLLLNHQLQ